MIHKYLSFSILIQCIISLESILEGQKDTLILRKIIKNLPIDLLKQNLAWIYEKYQKMYGTVYENEAFNHVKKKSGKNNILIQADLDPKNVQNKDKLGLIIESGFKIFLILKRYLEVEPSEKKDDETRKKK